MCPVCLTTTALVVSGASSTLGLAALSLKLLQIRRTTSLMAGSGQASAASCQSTMRVVTAPGSKRPSPISLTTSGSNAAA